MHGMKHRAVHFQFPRLSIHALNEGLPRSGGVQGECECGIIGRLHHDGVDEFLHAEFLVFGEINLRSADSGHFRIGFHPVVQADLPRPDGIEHDMEGHELEHAGGIAPFIGAIFLQHLARCGVDRDRPQIRRPGDGGRRRRRGRGSPRQGAAEGRP